MLRQFLRCKIHRATITYCDLNYVGSITVDADLLDAVGMRPNELVHVLDIDNGARFETYIIRGEPGSGVIGVNGAAAHLVETGHKVIILAYGLLTDVEVDEHVAQVAVVDEQNQISQRLEYPSTLAEPSPVI